MFQPIGNGLVSIIVPHLGRGENNLLLWSNSKQTDPIASFVGHSDVILDFAWRSNRENFSEIVNDLSVPKTKHKYKFSFRNWLHGLVIEHFACGKLMKRC